jgi:hypothetical protein
MEPFSYDDISHLLEYLNRHSYTAIPIYDLKISSAEGHQPEHIHSIGPVGHSTFKMNVQGALSVRALFNQYGTTVERIRWNNHNTAIAIYCRERAVHIKTDSIHFLEVCRHKLTEKGVSKITVDLKPR